MIEPENTGYPRRRSFRPRGSIEQLPVFLLWLVLLGVFVFAYRAGTLHVLAGFTGSPLFFPAVFVAVLAFSLGARVLIHFVRRRGAHASYWKGLASPTPDELIRWIDRSLGQAYMLPDLDALLAQSKAFAYSFYGDEARAVAALRTVRWNEKTPRIKAVGLGAESVIALLCRNDAGRALELARRAQGMGSVRWGISGGAQRRNYFATCVAVSTALSAGGTADTLRALEENTGAGRPPGLQLLATFGLAAALDQTGNAARAAELRVLLREKAPHCAPLHRTAGERIASAGSRTDDPVSASLPRS